MEKEDELPVAAKERAVAKSTLDAAKATLQDASDTFVAVASALSSGNDEEDVSRSYLMNRLLVHAEKILLSDNDAINLLGGSATRGKVLSKRDSIIVVGEGRQTEGIRTLVEFKGPHRSGTVLVVGDNRGVLCLKLTVGGTTLDLKMKDGLDLDVASGVKKLSP